MNERDQLIKYNLKQAQLAVGFDFLDEMIFFTKFEKCQIGS